MQIADVEALKEWLAKTMGPICDADPNTLAKYVIALLKKEKSEQELHLICVNELEAFLNTKTTEFVKLLFATLRDGSYAELGAAKELPQTIKELPVDAPPVVSSVGKIDLENSRSQDTKVLARANVSAVGTSSRGSRRDSLRGNEPRSKSRDRILPGRLGSGSRSHRTSRNEEDRRTHTSKAYGRRSRNRSRSRSRDRGWERRVPISRRSDLRERVDSLRDRNGRHSRDDRSHRRTSRARRARSRSRSRTPESRSRVRSPPRVYSHMRAYSRSRSRTLSRSLSPLPTPSSPNAAWSSKRVSRSRSSEGRDENTYRIKMPLDVVMSNSSAAAVDRANMMKGSLPDLSKPPPLKARCRDYDEQGLCLLGNLCPFDHGIDPVIVEDVNLPVPASLITFPGGQPAPVRARAPVPHSLAPLPPPPVVLTGPEIPLVAPTGVPLISSGASAIGPLQSVPASDMLPTSVVAAPTYSSVKSPLSTKAHADASLPPTVNRVERYIIPVYPRNPLDGKRVVVSARRDFNLTHVSLNQPDFTGVQDARYVIAQVGRSLDENMANKQLPFGRTRVFDPSRLGIRQSAVPTSKDGATLELAGIPTHLNTISSINQELSKYGTIVNIQVYYNGLADRALVSFAQTAEAAAAIHSSEPVFNNRFVTLSWHSTVKEVAVPEARKLSVKERLGTRLAETAFGVAEVQPFSEMSPEATADNLEAKPEKKMITVSPSGALTRTVFNKQLSNNNNNNAAENKPIVDVEPQSNHKDLRKEQLKVRLEIDKHKQLIMKKHVEKQKALLLRLESHDLGAEERKSIIETIKALEGHVQRMSAELNSSTVVLQPFVKKMPDKSLKSVVVNQFPQEPPKSRAEIRKSILDTELDLIAKENQGRDASDLKKKLAILKSQAASQGLLESRRGFGQPSRGRGGSFGGRGRGRRTPMALAAKLIDRRPKQLLVSGFAPAVVDQVVTVASRFTGVENAKYLSESNCILVTFHSRHDAEKAAIEGLRFQDQNLLMSWFDSRKSTKQIKKEEEEESAIEVAEGEADVGENANATEDEKKFSLEDDSESEVELIVEDDDYKEEELSNSVTIGFDEDMLDESELLRLDEDDDNDENLPQEMWQR